jgi:hypothetical protein
MTTRIPSSGGGTTSTGQVHDSSSTTVVSNNNSKQYTKYTEFVLFGHGGTNDPDKPELQPQIMFLECLDKERLSGSESDLFHKISAAMPDLQTLNEGARTAT